MESNVRITLDIDHPSSDQLLALAELLKSLGGGVTVSATPEKTTVKNKRAPKKTVEKTVEKPVEEAATEENAEKPGKEPANEEAGSVTLVELRAQLTLVVNEHRAEIKAKLEKLEAPNVTKLDPKHYEEFMTFLKGF